MPPRSNVIVVFNGHSTPARQAGSGEFKSPRSHLTPVTELGIRTGFRNQRPTGHVGSTPTRRTKVADAKERVTSGIGAESSGFDSLPGPTVFSATTFHRRCVEKGYFALKPKAAAGKPAAVQIAVVRDSTVAVVWWGTVPVLSRPVLDDEFTGCPG